STENNPSWHPCRPLCSCHFWWARVNSGPPACRREEYAGHVSHHEFYNLRVHETWTEILCRAVCPRSARERLATRSSLLQSQILPRLSNPIRPSRSLTAVWTT